MAPRAQKKQPTLNEQLALLEDPKPIDFDPEAQDAEFSASDDNDGVGSGSSGSDSEDEEEKEEEEDRAREHYVQVGKSKLRRGQENTELLGEAYKGAKVSRQKLLDGDSEDESESESESEDGSEEEGGVAFSDMDDADILEGSENDSEIDSDVAMDSDDEERFKSYKFKGSRTTEGGSPAERGDKLAGSSSSEEDEEDGGSENNSDQTNASGSEDDDEEEEESEDESEDEGRRRAALAKMLADERQAVATTLTAAARTDAEKGAAVRTQQHTFDGLLSSRIKFQKGLGAINSLYTYTPSSSSSTASHAAAEKAAVDLWNTIHTLRLSLPHYSSSIKRPAVEISTSTSLEELWTHMSTLSSAARPWQNQVLEKWSAKTTPVTTTSNSSKKLNNVAPRSLTTVLAETLSADQSRLLAKTRVPRADASLPSEDADIFDDTDFYQLQLKALIDSRTVDSGTAGAIDWSAVQAAKKRKKGEVDTRASKGRKLKYVVHEKLMNFMAPEEGADRWREEQRGELFRSLLGQKGNIIMGDGDDEVSEDDEMKMMEDDGLRIFR